MSALDVETKSTKQRLAVKLSLSVLVFLMLMIHATSAVSGERDSPAHSSILKMEYPTPAPKTSMRYEIDALKSKLEKMKPSEGSAALGKIIDKHIKPGDLISDAVAIFRNSGFDIQIVKIGRYQKELKYHEQIFDADYVISYLSISKFFIGNAFMAVHINPTNKNYFKYIKSVETSYSITTL